MMTSKSIIAKLFSFLLLNQELNVYLPPDFEIRICSDKVASRIRYIQRESIPKAAKYGL